VGVGLPTGGVKSQRGNRGSWRWAPPSALFAYLRLKRLQTRQLGNWYHFLKPIHRIKNLQTVKKLCGILFYCYYLPWWVVHCSSDECFYRVGQVALGMSLGTTDLSFALLSSVRLIWEIKARPEAARTLFVDHNCC
jgi:hypothetical protein